VEVERWAYRFLDLCCLVYSMVNLHSNWNIFVCQLYRARSVKACRSRCWRGINGDKRGRSKHMICRCCSWRYLSM